MTTARKSKAIRTLEKLNEGPLTLGQFLEAIRVGEKKTQSAFALELGISRAKLCDIEKGRRLVSPARAAAWGRKLGYGEKQFIRYALQDLVRQEGLDCTVTVG